MKRIIISVLLWGICGGLVLWRQDTIKRQQAEDSQQVSVLKDKISQEEIRNEKLLTQIEDTKQEKDSHFSATSKKDIDELKGQIASIDEQIKDKEKLQSQVEAAIAKRDEYKEIAQEEYNLMQGTVEIIDETYAKVEAVMDDGGVAAKIARGGVRLIDEPDLAEIYEYARKDPNWSEEQQGIHIGHRFVVGEELESSIREQIMQERYNLVID